MSFYSRFRIIGFLKIGFSPKASGFYSFGDATALPSEGGVGVVVWLIQALLEMRHAATPTAGAKHWHRQKAVFYVFCFSPPQYLSTEPFNPLKFYLHRFFDFLGGDWALGEHSDAATPNSLTPNP